MLKSKVLWAFVFGVITSALLLEAKINLAYSPLWSRVLEVLSAPGTHLTTWLNQPGVLMQGWEKFWTGLAFTCNLLIYILFWYACIWITAYARTRRHPYDRENTLVPPLTR
jgi:cbb3-type cytochrome oxidase subunit 3